MHNSSRQLPPASPCINVCVLGVSGHCVGCLRTGDEIAGWRDMSAQAQWQLIDELARRRGQQTEIHAVTPPDGSSNES